MKEKSLVEKTTQSISDSTDQLLHQLKSGFSKLSEIGSTAKNKFINYVKEVFDILPLIEKAGFRTNRLIVGISVPPSVEIHVSRFKEVDQKIIDQLLEEYKNRKMFKMILKSLLMSNEFQSKISTEQLVFNEICIEISIPPKVSIKYLNKDIAGIQTIETYFD
ncbi:hypothetical protein [uncultured Dokdonia sp.]|uniref:hypothetical protein n=1 Tax=uncultured Dokdonia sp. TaxID=575653 RepID=UPI002602F4E5|nr:hypothetical protein [uncultured Dokdonia sp.]